MKLPHTAALAATMLAVAALSGCAVYPAGPGEVYYDQPTYYRSGPPPVYYEPGPFYGPPPVYYGPGPVIINRGNWDRDRRGDRDRYDRGWRDGRDGRGQRPDGARPPQQAQPPQTQQPQRPPRPQGQSPSGMQSGSSDDLRFPGAPGLRRND